MAHFQNMRRMRHPLHTGPLGPSVLPMPPIGEFIQLSIPNMRTSHILNFCLLLLTSFFAHAVDIPLGEPNQGNVGELIRWRDDKFRGTRTYEIAQDIKIDFGLKLSVFATSHNKSLPKRVNLYFHNRSDEWEYMDFHPLILLVDGKRLPSPENGLSWNGDVGNGYVLEHMQLRLSPSLFRQIAFAKVVEGKLGLTEFTIKYEDREAFRAMSNAVLRTH